MNVSRAHCLAIVALAAVTMPLRGQTVTLSLTSPQSGDIVQPGATVNWSINFGVTGGNNAGLALLAVDLVQSAANPVKFDIPPAGGVPSAMLNFSRPAGISNAGENNQPTGYIGVQRGTTGQKDLRQIGGAQNTMGQTRPAGTGIAESANVVSNVGHGGNVTLAGGWFTAPSTPGVYTFQIENAIANVLTAVNTAPQHSTVARADTHIASGSISFIVGPNACDACDVNCDGVSNGVDIQRFVRSLQPAPPPPCSPCAGNMNASGGITVADVGPFVACLLGN